MLRVRTAPMDGPPRTTSGRHVVRQLPSGNWLVTSFYRCVGSIRKCRCPQRSRLVSPSAGTCSIGSTPDAVYLHRVRCRAVPTPAVSTRRPSPRRYAPPSSGSTTGVPPGSAASTGSVRYSTKPRISVPWAWSSSAVRTGRARPGPGRWCCGRRRCRSSRRAPRRPRAT